MWVHLLWDSSTKVPGMGSSFLKVLWVCCSYQCYCLHKACCYASSLVFHILYSMKLAIIRAPFITLFRMAVLLIKRLSQCSSASPLNPHQDEACVSDAILWKMAINPQCQLSVRSPAWAVHTTLPGSCSTAPITWPELYSFYFRCPLQRLGHHNVYWWAFPDWKGQPGITLRGHH